jgi:acyl-CoA reductase-like NAD-dependent aldehyde dehydrogenase
VLGDPLQPATTLGPMVKADAAQLVRDQIGAAVRAGATAHIDPATFPMEPENSPYMAPQVLSGVNHQMAVMRRKASAPWSASWPLPTTAKRSG